MSAVYDIACQLAREEIARGAFADDVARDLARVAGETLGAVRATSEARSLMLGDACVAMFRAAHAAIVKRRAAPDA